MEWQKRILISSCIIIFISYCISRYIIISFDAESEYDSYRMFRAVNELIEQSIGKKENAILEKTEWFPDHKILEQADRFSEMQREILETLKKYQLQEFDVEQRKQRKSLG